VDASLSFPIKIIERWGAGQYGDVGTCGIMRATIALQVSEFNVALDQYAPPSGN